MCFLLFYTPRQLRYFYNFLKFVWLQYKIFAESLNCHFSSYSRKVKLTNFSSLQRKIILIYFSNTKWWLVWVHNQIIILKMPYTFMSHHSSFTVYYLTLMTISQMDFMQLSGMIMSILIIQISFSYAHFRLNKYTTYICECSFKSLWLHHFDTKFSIIKF